MNETYCVYMHKNKINGKVYIGQTNNPQKRWSYNGIYYKPPKERENKSRFWNAICKYGWDNFEHIILVDNLTKDEVDEVEIELIEKYQATNREYGYNISKGGNGGKIYDEHPRGMLGKPQTEFQKKSHSLWASDNKNNCMTNGKVIWGETHEHPRGMLGKHHTEENKKTMTLKAVECTKKKILAIFPDGNKIIFPSVAQAMKELEISNTIAYRLLKTQEPYKLSKCVNFDKIERLSKLEGMKLLYFTEDTEEN